MKIEGVRYDSETGTIEFNTFLRAFKWERRARLHRILRGGKSGQWAVRGDDKEWRDDHDLTDWHKKRLLTLINEWKAANWMLIEWQLATRRETEK